MSLVNVNLNRWDFNNLNILKKYLKAIEIFNERFFNFSFCSNHDIEIFRTQSKTIID